MVDKGRKRAKPCSFNSRHYHRAATQKNAATFWKIEPPKRASQRNCDFAALFRAALLPCSQATDHIFDGQPKPRELCSSEHESEIPLIFAEACAAPASATT
jgi:hypothetical protein